MKRRCIFLSSLLLLPLFAFAQAAEDKGLGERIDTIFGQATGWFVEGIFAEIPFGEINEEVTLDLTNTNPLNYIKNTENDSIYLTEIRLPSNRIATEIDILSNNNLSVKDKNSIVFSTKDLNANQYITIMATSPYASIPWVLIVLIGGAFFFTFYFNFVNITQLKTAINVVRGKYEDIEKHGLDHLYGDLTPDDDIPETIRKEKKEIEKTKEETHDHLYGDLTPDDDIPETIRDEGADGEVSHFQALTAALSATVGLGNIAGVAVALSIGGPGATFWMIVAGILGMSSKFAECTLGVKYRDVGEDGTVYGGPMYYLSKGLKEIGMSGLGKVLAVLFAIMVIGGSFGGGNMFQANQAAAQFVELFDLGTNSAIIFGVVMACLVAIVIIGGIKRIASVTEKVVPFMAGIYVLAAVIILIANISLIPEAFSLIFEGAFSGLGIAGGLIGVLIQGIRRGAFSNEAGVGSAAIAHSAVRTKYPVSEGLVALLEPFIDTVVICTMTALVIIITNINGGFFEYGAEITQGVELTSTAFDTVIPNFSVVLTIAVILFAFSTMISWSYYGMQGWLYLFGRNKISNLIYKLLFVLFVIVGASIKLKSVIDFSDAMIFAMVVPNIIGVILLAPKVRVELRKYLAAIKKKKQLSKLAKSK